MPKPKLSVNIITKNEVENIARCLDSVAFADEIIVVDSGSTDGTQDICKAKGVTLIETDWPGFGIQKNRALNTTDASADWILSIDADEVVTPELKAEIIKIINDSDATYAAYRIPRFTTYFRKIPKMAHGFNRDYPIRLVKKNHGKFSEDPIHESLQIDGSIGLLKNYLHHHTFKNLDEFVYKINSYSSLGAQKMFAKNKSASKLGALLHAFWAFIRIYFFNGAFLAGWNGFLVALGNFEGTFYRYAKLIALNEEAKKAGKIS